MKHDKEYELLLDMSIDSLPVSEEVKIRCKRFHINSVRNLINERFDELDQLIERKFANELRLFSEINDLVISDRDPIELMDFMKPADPDEDFSCGKFKFRQFDFSQAGCYPTVDLWSKYLLMNNLVLIDFKGLLDCQSSVKRFTRLIGAKDLEGGVFCSIYDTGIIDLDPKELVQDTDHFVISKM